MGAAAACRVKTRPASEENRGQGPPSQVYLVVQERIACAINSAPEHNRGQGPPSQVHRVVQERIACAINSAPEHNRGQGPPSQVHRVVQERISCAIEIAPWHDRESGPAPTGVSCSVTGTPHARYRLQANRYPLTSAPLHITHSSTGR